MPSIDCTEIKGNLIRHRRAYYFKGEPRKISHCALKICGPESADYFVMTSDSKAYALKSSRNCCLASVQATFWGLNLRAEVSSAIPGPDSVAAFKRFTAKYSRRAKLGTL